MGPRSEVPKLIIRVINFELVQPICPRYVNVTDRETDGQTDGRLTIAIPRFALRASRGKNCLKEQIGLPPDITKRYQFGPPIPPLTGLARIIFAIICITDYLLV